MTHDHVESPSDIKQVLGLASRGGKRRRALTWAALAIILGLALWGTTVLFSGNPGKPNFRTAEALRGELVLMPLRTFWRRLAGNQDVSLIQVSAREGTDTDRVKSDVEREVLLQFLVKAVALSSLGGVIGIVVALLASTVAARALNVPFIFNGGIVLVAFLFSATVGVIFGFFPARKAARMNPIDALRHE